MNKWIKWINELNQGNGVKGAVYISFRDIVYS